VAKEVKTWDALYRVILFEQNWLRPHRALRVPLATPWEGCRYHQWPPAMAIGLTDHPWSWDEFLHFRAQHC